MKSNAPDLNAMARNIANLKDKKSKQFQVHLVCAELKKLLSSGK